MQAFLVYILPHIIWACLCAGGISAHSTWLYFVCESALVAVQLFPWAQRGGSHILQRQKQRVRLLTVISLVF